jgi:hypothetical protein
MLYLPCSFIVIIIHGVSMKGVYENTVLKAYRANIACDVFHFYVFQQKHVFLCAYMSSFVSQVLFIFAVEFVTKQDTFSDTRCTLQFNQVYVAIRLGEISRNADSVNLSSPPYEMPLLPRNLEGALKYHNAVSTSPLAVLEVEEDVLILLPVLGTELMP